MKPIITLASIIFFSFAAMNVAPKVNTTSKLNISRIESSNSVAVAQSPPETKTPVTRPVEEPKAEVQIPAPPTQQPQIKAAQVPYGVHDIGGYGDCAAEIAKYDWIISVATKVASAESGMRPGVINNNPSTRDYSVGCFQVNIYGTNAINRPPQEELINAAVNVRWAYNNYVGHNRSFIGQWGVCQRGIACY